MPISKSLGSSLDYLKHLSKYSRSFERLSRLGRYLKTERDEVYPKIIACWDGKAPIKEAYKKDLGNDTYDLSGGTDLFKIDSEGQTHIPSNIQSTNKTSGALTVVGGVGISGDLRASEIIASGNVQAQGAFLGNVTGQVSTLSNHNTGGLTEGSNLYYTTTRADSGRKTSVP